MKKMGATNKEVEILLNYQKLANDPNAIKAGDKVTLNYDKLVSEKDYENKTDNYKEFIETNKDTVFTVENDKYFANTRNNFVFQLKEDTSERKWLWFIDDLIKVENSKDEENE